MIEDADPHTPATHVIYVNIKELSDEIRLLQDMHADGICPLTKQKTASAGRKATVPKLERLTSIGSTTNSVGNSVGSSPFVAKLDGSIDAAEGSRFFRSTSFATFDVEHTPSKKDSMKELLTRSNSFTHLPDDSTIPEGLSEPLSVPPSSDDPKKCGCVPKFKRKYLLEDECYSHLHYGILSMLLSWGLDPEIDELVSKEIGLQRPTVDTSFGLMGEGGAMALLVPSYASGSNRWNYSSYLTGLHNMALVSTFMSLMNGAKRDMRYMHLFDLGMIVNCTVSLHLLRFSFIYVTRFVSCIYSIQHATTWFPF